MGESARVFVVDDDAGWRLTVSVWIDPAEGLELVAARSLAGFAELVADIGTATPQALIIDPAGEGSVDGIALLRTARRRWPETTIFAYSHDGALAEAALAAGADVVIDKVTDPRTAVSMLVLALRRRAH